jgi:hypothetical protein
MSKNIFTRISISVWRMLGHLKFAVCIILIFALCLAIGTIVESNQGTDYANRYMYKSLGFMGLQLLIFLSVLVATLQRLPWRPNLAGFYVLHLGLLTLIAGSAITYLYGVDGHLSLYPKVPTQNVELGKDQLKLSSQQNAGQQALLDLPYTYQETLMDFAWSEIKVKRYYPFADLELQWIKNDSSLPILSAQYQLQNDRFSESITLSQHHLSDFPTSTSIGPLNIHFLPEQLFECFIKETKLGLLAWNLHTGECLALEQSSIKTFKAKDGKSLIKLKSLQLPMSFAPQEGPLPLVEKLDGQWVQTETFPWRLFNKKLFESVPHLLLFGEGMAYFNKNSSEWEHQTTDRKNPQWHDLPWMGFKLKLMRLDEKFYPKNIPVPVVPVQNNSQLISGAIRAVELEYFNLLKGQNETLWVTNQNAMKFMHHGVIWEASVGKEQKELPFEMRLSSFKMDTDPGTNNPASYESFVALRDTENAGKHHVYMNHPLKHREYTFYQASYFQVEEGYGSVLSVNYDPGRFWKYLGSLLLVLGSLWHFSIRKWWAKYSRTKRTRG